MKVSIIIPVKTYSDSVKTCLNHCLELDYQDFEIIVVCDWTMAFSDKRVKICSSGPNRLLAKKRNIGAGTAQGDILAFLEEDTYPKQNWLSSALKNFESKDIAAVGGPVMTPPGEKLLCRASGFVEESFIVSGNFYRSDAKKEKKIVNNPPINNLLVRKDAFDMVKGFNLNLWPGENEFFCQNIITSGMKIIHDPDVLVYKKRPPLFLRYLKQVKMRALRRGYLSKTYPKTAFQKRYCAPSLFVLWLFFGSLPPGWWPFYLFFLAAYSVVVFASAYHKNNPKLTSLVFAGIFATHFSYGLYFVYGLLKTPLEPDDVEE